MGHRPDEFAKPCIVKYKPTGHYMAYSEEGNYLYLAGNDYYIFPAKLRARSAISVTIEMDKAAGKDRPQDDYEIVDY